jgi:S-adenosylhomocysteine hydrolase
VDDTPVSRDPLPEDLRFDGTTIRIISQDRDWVSDEVTVDDQTGEPVNDAVYNRQMAVESRLARENIMGYKLEGGQWVYIIAEGRLVNLASGDGHPAEIMDMSFAIQALSAKYVVEHFSQSKGTPGEMAFEIPEEIDSMVAMRKLNSWGYCIDTLTEAQKGYLGL